jgi:hypothetical protein
MRLKPSQEMLAFFPGGYNMEVFIRYFQPSKL